MRIECPACATAYEVPDAQLTPGQVVRCARCGTDWAPLAAPPPLPEPAAPDAAPEPERPKAPEPVLPPTPKAEASLAPTVQAPPAVPARARPWALRIAWAVSILAVLGGLAGLYLERERLMRVWPPSIRAYAALGLAPR